MMVLRIICLFVLAGFNAKAESPNQRSILADTSILKQANIPILYSDSSLNIGYALIDDKMEKKLSQVAHDAGRCGGFEALKPETKLEDIKASFQTMLFLKNQDLSYRRGPITSPVINPKEDILSAVNQLSSAELKNWVTWITSFPSRYHKLEKPNVHVEALAEKLKTIMSASNHPYQIDMIDHKSTKQKSLRLRLTGSTSPDDLVILGAHFDSIVSYGNDFAPGADDDASGSANLLEVLRVLLKQERPQRSVEFLWYAGEESGLLGSAEIAESYKKTGKKVISVLQLDMTLFPGAGKNRLALITDYTSAWLNDILLKLSQAYLTVEVLESQCGYACSDHASWHKNGFSAAMPFESTFDTYNKEIHTRNDVISPRLDFEHSLQFSKLAMAYVMELANSQATNPIY